VCGGYLLRRRPAAEVRDLGQGMASWGPAEGTCGMYVPYTNSLRGRVRVSGF
jgi:hypothetical protein